MFSLLAATPVCFYITKCSFTMVSIKLCKCRCRDQRYTVIICKYRTETKREGKDYILQLCMHVGVGIVIIAVVKV